jgi:hypothetical protein
MAKSRASQQKRPGGNAREHQGFIEWNIKAMRNQGFSFNVRPPASEREDIEYMARGFL